MYTIGIMERKDKPVADRISFEESTGHTAYFHTSFNLDVLGRHGRGDLTGKGDVLNSALRGVQGISAGETSIQLNNHYVFVSKLPAVHWEEITPQLISVLKESYNLQEVEFEKLDK